MSDCASYDVVLTEVEAVAAVNDPVEVSISLVSAAPVSGDYLSETFETVSKNLKAYDGVLGYTGDDLTTITYTTATGTIVKTLGYDSTGQLETITLSGDTPNGIDLVKTLGYDSTGNLETVTYSAA